MNPIVRVILGDGAVLPKYHSAGAAGMDVCCSETFTLAPFERRLVSTGLRLAIPEGYEAQMRPRSGLAIRYGIAMVNAPGTIDSDYRGELRIILINLGSDAVEFNRGERVGQMVVCPVARATLEIVEELDETHRGEGGFGSTGV